MTNPQLSNLCELKAEYFEKHTMAYGIPFFSSYITAQKLKFFQPTIEKNSVSNNPNSSFYVYIQGVFISIVFQLILFQNGNAQASQFQFDHLTIADGLSQSSVFSIAQDRNGFMWFGTRAGGLNKYDGYSFVTYKFDEFDSTSISGNEILAIKEDHTGNIWVGTQNDGLNRFDYDTEKFHPYFFDPKDSSSLPSDAVNSLFVDSEGFLWIGTNNGLCLYNKEKDNFKRISSEQLSTSKILCMTPSSVKYAIWIGTNTGLYLFDTKSLLVIKHYQHDAANSQSLGDDFIRVVLEDKKGRVWVGTNSAGLNRMNDPNTGIFKKFIHNPKDKNSITSDVVRTLHEDKNGELWIGTKIALEQLVASEQNLDNPQFIHHKKDESDDRSINQNSIFSFFEDQAGNFWIGTYNNGLNYLYRGAQKFKYFKHQIYNPLSLGNNVVSSFAENDKGIWIGTEGGGLNLFDRKNGQFQHFVMEIKNPTSITSNHVKSILIDRDNNLWVGSFNGLHLYNPSTNQFKLYLKGLNIYTIEEGLEDDLWVGTDDHLLRFNTIDKTAKYYESSNDPQSISSESVNKIYKSKKGEIWIATREGLNHYNRTLDNFTRYMHDKNDPSSISHSHVTTICEDSNGQLWIGTFDGLNIFNAQSKSFKHFGEKDGLKGNVISNVIADNEGYLWLTTNRFLSKFNPFPNANKDSIGTIEKRVLRSFDVVDGLQGGEFRQNSAWKNEKGELFFGGILGFNFFNPDELHDNPIAPPVVITDLKLFNKTVMIGEENGILSKHISQTDKITLTHKQYVLNIDFAALNYTSSKNNQYAYMLEGFDESWNYAGHKREAIYTKLPPDTYIFRVIASNNDGVWNEEGARLIIQVLPPWWETWWFRSLIIAGLVTILFLSYVIRTRGIRRTNQILESTVKRKTQLVTEQNKILKEQQEELAAQNEELIQSQEEVSSQRDLLSQQNQILSTRQEIIEQQNENLEDEVAKRTKELVEYNHQLEQFSFITAHNLRAPVARILGLGQLLDLAKNDIKEKDFIYPKLIHTAKDLDGVVKDLNTILEIKKNNESFLSDIDLHSVLSKILENLKQEIATTGAEITFDFNQVASLHSVKAYIESILYNLISNAIKYRHPYRKPSIHIKTEKHPTEICLIISDNGLGIDVTLHEEKLFTLYSRFHLHVEGKGMGLYLVKTQLVALGGRIEIESEVNKGTSFRAYFKIGKNGVDPH